MDFWSLIQMKWQWHWPWILYQSMPIEKFDDWQLATGWIESPYWTSKGPSMAFHTMSTVPLDISHQWGIQLLFLQTHRCMSIWAFDPLWSLQHPLLVIQTSFGGGFPQRLLLKPIVEGLCERCHYRAIGVVQFLGRGWIESDYAQLFLWLVWTFYLFYAIFLFGVILRISGGWL